MSTTPSTLPDSEHHHRLLCSRKKDVLLRLAGLDPRELCNEAIVEKCRATRDLRGCGKPVKHALTSCNHASLCAECCQRCEFCPICRIPIMKRHGGTPVMKPRIFEECIESGLISSKEEQTCEEDGISNASVRRLWLFFDVALENKAVSVICHYVSDVCMDDKAVSSNAIISMLLDGTVVIEWCKRTFMQIIQSLQDIYSLEPREMHMNLGQLEDFSSKLHGLCNVLESLEGPTSDEMSTPFLELQQLVEGVGRVSQHLDLMSWCAKHDFLENISSRHSTIDDWKNAFEVRKVSANSRAWPNHIRHSWESTFNEPATLFIEDALENIGFGEDMDNDFLRETPDLECLKQEPAMTSVMRETVRAFSTGVYPPKSVRTAVDIIFLETNADLFLAKKAIFLYYLFDRQWSHSDNRWKIVLDDYLFTFDISRHAMLESLLFFLLDENSEIALEEACVLLPEVVSPNIHPKVARVLLERKRPKVALDVLYSSGGDGALKLSNSSSSGEVPSLVDAVTAVRVRLECGLLTEAYLYQRSYTSRVISKAQQNAVSKTKSSDKDDCRDWFSDMQSLVGEICSLCMRKNLLNKMIELPWQEDEERILFSFLLEQATQNPCSTAGSLMIIYYIMRCRYREVYLTHKKLSFIENTFITQCENPEKRDLVKSICTNRTKLVGKCIEILPEIQQEELKSGALDKLLPQSGERGTLDNHLSSTTTVSTSMKDIAHPFTAVTLPFNDKNEDFMSSQKSLLEFPKTMAWDNGQQPSVPGKSSKILFGGVDLLSTSSKSYTTPGRQQNEGLLTSHIFGRRLMFNGETDSSYDNQRPGISGTEDANTKASNGIIGSKQFSHTKLSLQEYGTPRSSNQRGKNGSVTLKTDSDSTSLSNWVENGGITNMDLLRKDRVFDLSSKYRHQRQTAYSSPNGKRKAPEFAC